MGAPVLHISLLNRLCQPTLFFRIMLPKGTPVAQEVKCWPADLAVPDSIPSGGEHISNHKQGSLAHSFLSSPKNCPGMTEILFKRT